MSKDKLKNKIAEKIFYKNKEEQVEEENEFKQLQIDYGIELDEPIKRKGRFFLKLSKYLSFLLFLTSVYISNLIFPIIPLFKNFLSNLILIVMVFVFVTAMTGLPFVLSDFYARLQIALEKAKSSPLNVKSTRNKSAYSKIKKALAKAKKNFSVGMFGLFMFVILMLINKVIFKKNLFQFLRSLEYFFQFTLLLVSFSFIIFSPMTYMYIDKMYLSKITEKAVTETFITQNKK